MPQQRIIRRATPADFAAIYELQKSPNRDLAFDTPLPDYDNFVDDLTSKTEKGEEIYYVLEADSKVIAFLWFKEIDGRLWATFWGRWIKTLFHAAGKIAFDILGYPRIFFSVRTDNKRFNDYCKERDARKIGETQGIYVRESDMIVAVSNVYEITSEEFQRMIPASTEQSLEFTYEGSTTE